VDIRRLRWWRHSYLARFSATRPLSSTFWPSATYLFSLYGNGGNVHTPFTAHLPTTPAAAGTQRPRHHYCLQPGQNCLAKHRNASNDACGPILKMPAGERRRIASNMTPPDYKRAIERHNLTAHGG